MYVVASFLFFEARSRRCLYSITHSSAASTRSTSAAVNSLCYDTLSSSYASLSSSLWSSQHDYQDLCCCRSAAVLRLDSSMVCHQPDVSLQKEEQGFNSFRLLFPL